MFIMMKVKVVEGDGSVLREKKQGKDVRVDLCRRGWVRTFCVARLAKTVATGFKRDVPPRAKGDVTRFRRVSVETRAGCSNEALQNGPTSEYA
jgi:hypothetical protein